MKKTISAALCAALLLSLVSCGQKAEEPVMDATVTVEAVTARTGDLSAESTYIGSISSEGTASVIALVSGRVEELHVSVGDTVTVGQALCSIDDTAARLQLSTAQAAVATAQAGQASAKAGMASAQAGQASAKAGMEQTQAAVQSAQESYQGALAQYGSDGESDSLPIIEEQVRLAEDNYKNTVALFDIGAASQIEVDQANQAMISARAGLQAAKASLSAAQAGVRQAQAGIASAEAGAQSAQAGILSAEAGAQSAAAGLQQAQAAVAAAEYQLSLYHLTSPISGVVEAVNVTENNFTASGTPAFVISNGSNKTVTFYVTDQVRRTMAVGQSVTVSAGGRSYTGVLTELGGVVDAQTGQFKAKAIIRAASDLPDGLAVELTTLAYAAHDAVLVPSDALYFESGATYVYLLQDGVAVRTDVTVALTTADTVAVTGGLREGDQVITTWSAGLRSGAAVRIAGEQEG